MENHGSESYVADDTNLYITNLPETFSEIQLRELFKGYGEIASIRLIGDPFGMSKCKAFVKYTQRASAEEAIRCLNGSCLYNPSEPLQVKFANKTAASSKLPNIPNDAGQGFNSAGSGGPMRNRPQSNNRFNPMGMTGPNNHPMGGPMGGPMNDSMNMYPQHPPPPPSMGYPNMPPPQEIPPDIPAPSDEMIANCFNQKQGWSLYVSNLLEDSDELALYRLFSPFGPITSINPMLDKSSGKCRGFGFVNMPKYDTAFEAVRLMHGVELEPGRNIRVSFKTNRKPQQGGYEAY